MRPAEARRPSARNLHMDTPPGKRPACPRAGVLGHGVLGHGVNGWDERYRTVRVGGRRPAVRSRTALCARAHDLPRLRPGSQPPPIDGSQTAVDVGCPRCCHETHNPGAVLFPVCGRPRPYPGPVPSDPVDDDETEDPDGIDARNARKLRRPALRPEDQARVDAFTGPGAQAPHSWRPPPASLHSAVRPEAVR
jgi:hypothetical protein